MTIREKKIVFGFLMAAVVVFVVGMIVTFFIPDKRLMFALFVVCSVLTNIGVGFWDEWVLLIYIPYTGFIGLLLWAAYFGSAA